MTFSKDAPLFALRNKDNPRVKDMVLILKNVDPIRTEVLGEVSGEEDVEEASRAVRNSPGPSWVGQRAQGQPGIRRSPLLLWVAPSLKINSLHPCRVRDLGNCMRQER